MRKILSALLFLLPAFLQTTAQTTVTDITANYRRGQVFVVWKVIPQYEGFYYLYKYKNPITSSNLDSAKYVGRVPHNFSFNYFLNLGTAGGMGNQPLRYLIINNNPTQQLDSTDGLFVLTCAEDNKPYYYAITYDNEAGNEIKTIVPAENATTAAVLEKVSTVKPVLQIDDLPLLADENQLYDAYVVFGGNVTTQFILPFTNEACLVFNFGIVKNSYDSDEKNGLAVFYYGGGGNSFTNCNGEYVEGLWKLSLEDVIPNFNWDPVGGENVKWIGYNENFDVYGANLNSPYPTTGLDYAYSLNRVKWSLDWMFAAFENQLDPNRVYTFGSSSGCVGAMLTAYLFPNRIAACDLVDGKLDITYYKDDNPACKWNPGKVSRNKTNIFLGDYDHNLEVAWPRIDDTGNYHINEYANFNVLAEDNKFNDIPIVYLTSGKEDIVTCWEEKIPFYSTVEKFRLGGFYFWDLREHHTNDIQVPDRTVQSFMRYRQDQSYPAFSNCSINNYPGDENNPSPPYYDGDPIGTINGMLDWVDSTIIETPDSWEGVIFSKQITLVNGELLPATLPANLKVDITLKRLQQFKNIPDGQKLCLENYKGGALKQTKDITYQTDEDGNGVITFKKVQISKKGNLIRIYKCSSPKEWYSTNPFPKVAVQDLYPNPASSATLLEFSLTEDMQCKAIVRNLLGDELRKIDAGILSSGDQSIKIDLVGLPSGIYLIELMTGNLHSMHKVIKE